jgi:hypothetical protein
MFNKNQAHTIVYTADDVARAAATARVPGREYPSGTWEQTWQFGPGDDAESVRGDEGASKCMKR